MNETVSVAINPRIRKLRSFQNRISSTADSLHSVINQLSSGRIASQVSLAPIRVKLEEVMAQEKYSEVISDVTNALRKVPQYASDQLARIAAHDSNNVPSS